MAASSNRAARNYADALNAVATSYEQQVSAKVKAEEESYRQLGLVYDQAIQDSAYGTLDLERFERAQKLTDDTIAGGAHRMTPSQLTSALRAYGDLDFQTMKQQLGAEQAAHIQILSGLQNLEVDLKSIQALAKALQGLSTPESLKSQIIDAASYENSVKTELQSLNCAELKERLKQLQAQQSKSSPAVTNSIAQQVKEVQGLIKVNNCN